KSVEGITFSPDSRTLVTSSYVESHRASSPILQFWNLSDSRSPAQDFVWRTGTDSYVNELAFSTDGKLIGAGYLDGVRSWNVSLDSWREQGCRIAARNLTYDEWKNHLANQSYRLTCAGFPPHSSFIDAGRSLAEVGNVDG